MASGVPVVVQDIRNDPRYLTTFGATLAEAIFPVRVRGTVVGTIDVESEQVNAFCVADQSFLTRCAEVLAGLWE